MAASRCGSGPAVPRAATAEPGSAPVDPARARWRGRGPGSGFASRPWATASSRSAAALRPAESGRRAPPRARRSGRGRSLPARLEQCAGAPVAGALLLVAVGIGARRQLVEPDQARRRGFHRSTAPREPEQRIAAQVALGMVIQNRGGARAPSPDPGRGAPRRPGCRARRRRARTAGIARQGFPERPGVGLPAIDSICASTNSARERTSGSAQRSTTCASAARARPYSRSFRSARPWSSFTRQASGSAGSAGVCSTSVGVGWCCWARRQSRQRRLQVSGGAAVAGAAAGTQGRNADVRELVERFAVAVRVEQDLRAAHQERGGDGTAGPSWLSRSRAESAAGESGCSTHAARQWMRAFAGAPAASCASPAIRCAAATSARI